MRRRTALLLSSIAALSCPSLLLATQPRHLIYSMSALGSMRLSVNSIDTEPINGFIPQVVMGLTNEQDDDSANGGAEGFGIQSSAPGGSALPTTGTTPFYALATLDSGSTSDIISYDATQSFDLNGSNILDGGNQVITAAGASGTEDFTVTNAMGVYVTDFSHASVNGAGALTVASGSLQGQYNVPALAGNEGDGIPNIVGSPILAQYRATIANSQPQHLTVGGVVYQTPKVTLGAFNTSVPSGYGIVRLAPIDGLLGGAESENTPYYLNLSGALDGGTAGPIDPDTPGTWASMLTSVNNAVGVSRGGTNANFSSFLLDTGAQVSIISTDTAAQLGIFNVSTANADFTEQVQGVGGITTDVPGYYLNTMALLTTAGILTWTHVPVLVLDVTNPSDQTQTLPGILGTNLFSDRDIILNTNVSVAGQTYLAIGPQMMWNHSSGNWSNAGNWQVVLPNGQDMQANFYGAAKAPATINVDIPVTVGRITFDNANSYTLSGSNTITMSDSADQAQINLRSGNHTIATPVSLASDTIVTVIPATSTLTMSGPISSNGTFGITVSGNGTLLLSGSNTYSGETNVSMGTMTVTGSITSTNVMTAIGAVLNAAGHVNAGLSTSTVLDSNGIVNIGPNANTSGPAAVTLASIEVGSDPTSNVTVLSSPLHANRTVLVTSALTFDSTTAGQLDLKDNDMIIHGSTLAAVQAMVQTGLNLAGGNSGYWNGSGIVSSTAAGNTAYLTTLGVILNNNGTGTRIYSSTSPLGSFDNQNTSNTDILVKYVYFGDTNLDGKVDGSDYSRIDNGSLRHLSGWYNGDFNYDGLINGSDYTLIDNAFNRQGAQLSDVIASVTTEIAPVSPASSVPEPTSLAVVSLVAVAFLGRRKKLHLPRVL